MSESAVLKNIMLSCCRGAVRLWRNNVGALKDKNGVWIRYGVCNPGGSDLIGYRSVKVTPEMVGSTLAVLACIEVKAPGGRLRPEQSQFLSAVQAAGGLAGVARSPEEAAAILDALPARQAPPL